MGTKYSTILTGGVVATYNDDPPPDDGSQTEANRTKYSTVTGDLTSPLHSAHQNADGNLIAHFNEGPTTKSSNYTTDADDYNTVIECTGSPTISLFTPGTAGKSYRVTVKNAGSGVVDLDVSGGGNIDGNSCYKLGPTQAGTFFVNDAENAYYTKHTANEFAADTTMLFYQSTAPNGWTIVTALDQHMLRVTSGSSPVGGTNGGTYNFSAVFTTTISEGGSPGVGNHTLTAAESGLPAHQHDISPTATSQNNTGGTPAGTTGGSAGTFETDFSSAASASSGHSHTLDIRCKWAAVIVCTKDGGCGGGS